MAAREGEARREVIVGGRRARVIDTHAHCSVPEANALLDAPVIMPALLLANAEQRIKAMDVQGIDVEALSINPFWYGADQGIAAEVVSLQNDRLSQFCASNPDRFTGLATVALQHPELAAAQLEAAVREFGLRGALIGGSVNGEELSHERFHPFWEKAEALGVLIFIHPQGTPELASRLRGNGMLENTIGNPLETTLALSHLIFQGTLDRFPGLRILAAHGGGYLPSYAARSDAVGRTFPARVTPLAKLPSEHLRQLYYDSLVFTPEALRHLVAEVGAGQIVLGTDHPFPWTSSAVDHVLSTPGLSEDDKVAILGGTAERLLGLAAVEQGRASGAPVEPSPRQR